MYNFQTIYSLVYIYMYVCIVKIAASREIVGSLVHLEKMIYSRHASRS